MIRPALVRPWTDAFTVPLAVLTYWLIWRAGGDPLSALPRSGRENLLQTLGGVSVALLGLGGTVTAIVFAVTPGRRLAAVTAAWGDQLNRLLAWSLAEFGVATFASLLLAGLDGATRDQGQRYGVVATLVLITVATCRLLRILGTLLAVAAADARDSTSETRATPPVQPEAVDYEQYRLPRAPRRQNPAQRPQ